MCVARKLFSQLDNGLDWCVHLFSRSHIKAASYGGAGHEEVDDIDHTSFNIEKININGDNEHDGGEHTLIWPLAMVRAMLMMAMLMMKKLKVKMNKFKVKMKKLMFFTLIWPLAMVRAMLMIAVVMMKKLKIKMNKLIVMLFTLIWPLAMVRAAPEVKPAITGWEMKSIKKPSLKLLMMMMITSMLRSTMIPKHVDHDVFDEALMIMIMKTVIMLNIMTRWRRRKCTGGCRRWRRWRRWKRRAGGRSKFRRAATRKKYVMKSRCLKNYYHKPPCLQKILLQSWSPWLLSDRSSHLLCWRKKETNSTKTER